MGGSMFPADPLSVVTPVPLEPRFLTLRLPNLSLVRLTPDLRGLRPSLFESASCGLVNV